MTTPPPLPERSSTGLDLRLAAMLTYVLGFVSGIGFLLVERDSRFVRFHAVQSTLAFGGLFGLNILLGMIPFVGWLISFLLVPVTVVLWLLLMFKAYQGETYKLPKLGDIAERQVR
jgi:uncharacterized membrane protein